VNGAVRSPDALADDVVPAADSVPAQWPGECQRPPALHLIVRRSVPVTLVDAPYPLPSTLLVDGRRSAVGRRSAPAPGRSGVAAPGQPRGARSSRLRPACDAGHGAGGRRTLHTRTSAARWSGARPGRIALMGRDYSMPPPGARVSDDMVVQVVRVQETIKIKQETTPMRRTGLRSRTCRLTRRRSFSRDRMGDQVALSYGL